MDKDGSDVYHADQDCWQQNFGYNDLFDLAFSMGISMLKAKFPFTSGSKEYILWARKGDHINLGAGAEMDIYQGHTISGSKTPLWDVNRSLAMTMSMTLRYKVSTIINYAPSEKQWWITGFHPAYKNVLASKLTASFTVTFNSKQMYKDFNKVWGGDKR